MTLEELFPQGTEFVRPPQNIGDAGFDIIMRESVVIYPKQMSKFDTGIRVNGRDGHIFDIRRRSSAQQIRIYVDGVVDPRYKGTISLTIENLSDNVVLCLERGKAYAQGIFIPFLNPLTEQPTKERGENGFGSTG